MAGSACKEQCREEVLKRCSSVDGSSFGVQRHMGEVQVSTGATKSGRGRGRGRGRGGGRGCGLQLRGTCKNACCCGRARCAL
eukprot:378695-Amphidinium_carterae.2